MSKTDLSAAILPVIAVWALLTKTRSEQHRHRHQEAGLWRVIGSVIDRSPMQMAELHLSKCDTRSQRSTGKP